MSRSGRRAARRDQEETVFTSILRSLVGRVPGALAAALVDCEGETVDYAGRVDPYALRLAAAHWRIVLKDMHATRSLSGPWFFVRAARASYVVSALPDAYALVLVLTRRAGFSGWSRAVGSCSRVLSGEAGWAWPKDSPASWFPVDVTAPRRRPLSIAWASRQYSVEVLGKVATGLDRREHGWRVRYESGVEATLVREPGGAWYSDEPPAATEH